MSSKETNPKDGCGLVDNPDYPLADIDRVRLNQIIRHRVRNVCGGCRMILDVVRSHVDEIVESPFDWGALYGEIDDVQRFSHRLDLLIEPLPPPQPGDLAGIFTEARRDFSRHFPLCTLELEGGGESCEHPAANWLALALGELLANAGRAAGNRGAGTAEIAWQTAPALQIVVANNGTPFPADIPVAPPVPFRTAAPSRDGIGLAIVHRLCLALGMEMVVRTDLPDMVAVVLSRKSPT